MSDETHESKAVVLYEAMVTAIDQCHRVDEVKDIRDKSLALEVYARQAHNVEAEQKAIEIRIRAERKVGQLLQEMQRGNAGRPRNSVQAEPNLSEYQKAKHDAGISATQAKRWQKLAEMPHVDFEHKLHQPLVSTSAVIGETSQPRQLPPRALWLWGTLCDFRREGMFDVDINEIVAEAEKSGVQHQFDELIPRLISWLSEFQGVSKWKKAASS
jgi:hypothetical protein